MRILDAAQTAAALPFDRLIQALREAFIAGADVPLRHRHDIAQLDISRANRVQGHRAQRREGRLFEGDR